MSTTILVGGRATSLAGVRHLDVRQAVGGWTVVAVWPDESEAALTEPAPLEHARRMQNRLAVRIGGR